MRLRAKLPSSSSEILTLPDDATVENLIASLLNIPEISDASSFECRTGFPPKIVDLSNSMMLLKEVGILNGDQITVTTTSGDVASSNEGVQGSSQTESAALPDEIKHLISGINTSTVTPRREPDDKKGPPEVRLGPDNVVVLRVMEDDNSCLFRAIGYALLRNLDTMHELRSLVASAIIDNPEEYSDAVLGRPANEYCEWIVKPTSWGGAIEMAILANHFDITICSMDVATGRTDQFNPGRPTFIIVIYSGIHYDAVALAPAGVDGMHDFDQTVFDNNDSGQHVLAASQDLLKILKDRHYFTDTARFSIRCDQCGLVLHGEIEAQSHSEQTGHYKFQEVSV
ncbi:hypothetical protein V1511DRAFT_493994 [Dipodascopsis uninucleata]